MELLIEKFEGSGADAIDARAKFGQDWQDSQDVSRVKKSFADSGQEFDFTSVRMVGSFEPSSDHGKV